MLGIPGNSGTGFYINLPAAQDKDVILTAAHNLIDAEGQWSSDISFQSADGSPKRSITVRDKKSGGSEKAIDIAWLAVKVKSPGNEGSPEKEGPPEPRVEKVTVEGHLHVSERYTQPLYARMSSSGEAGPRFPMSLEDEIAPYDYGAIIFDRGKGDMPRGFGFSLMLGVDSKDTSGRRPKMVSPHGSVKLYGYASDEAQPRSWEGDYRTIPDQVMYNMNTKPGLSGSPVLTGYKSAETVIAIQYASLPSIPCCAKPLPPPRPRKALITSSRGTMANPCMISSPQQLWKREMGQETLGARCLDKRGPQ